MGTNWPPLVMLAMTLFKMKTEPKVLVEGTYPPLSHWPHHFLLSRILDGHKFTLPTWDPEHSDLPSLLDIFILYKYIFLS